MGIVSMSLAPEDPALPLYAQVKAHILDGIAAGQWAVGAQIPSENELVALLKVSRMTVNRALRELCADGHLSREQGRGTFVQAPIARADFLEIRDIAADVTARGHVHRAEVVTLMAQHADSELAADFNLPAGAEVFFSKIIHFEDDTPIQLEERFISPAFAPDYLAQDFSTQSTTHYLNSLSLATEVEHIAYAIKPGKDVQQALRIAATDPCLLLARRTWVDDVPATKSRLSHPGNRFSLGARYKTGH
jgi:GntR family histidine utilization transcriptional repressor